MNTTGLLTRDALIKILVADGYHAFDARDYVRYCADNLKPLLAGGRMYQARPWQGPNVKFHRVTL